ERGADAVLDERAGQVAEGRVRGLPAGAVSRDDHLGREPSGARTVSAMTLTRAMDSWMPGRWNLESQQVIGAAHSINPECRAAGSSEIDLVASLLSLQWRGRGRPDKPRRTRAGPCPAGRTPVQLHVAAV